ncbi:MAG TPA: efflux transporter outer membrane subunit [Kofleriaceae bacterium]
MKRALLVAALAGCTSMAPKYERPAAPIRTQLPGGAGTDALPSLEAFIHNGSLRQLVGQALTANRDLRRAAEDITSARALYRVQRAAALPTVDVSASVTSQRQLTGLPDNATASGTGAAVLGMASWEIDVFGRIKSLSNAKEEQVLSAVEVARAARVSLVGELCTAYVTIAADKKRLAIANETMENGKRVMDLSDKLVGGGTTNRSDYYQAATVYQQARADVALLTATIEQDKNAIELLAGGPVDAGLLPDALPDTPDWFADVPAGLSSEVLLERPDVQAAEHDLKAANANIGAARAQFFPSLSLTANGGLASTTLGALFSGPAFVFQIIPSLAAPLFRGGANRANLAYTESQKRALVSAYEAAIQRAFRDVADALAVKATIVEQLDAQHALVDAATKSLEISQARYQAGVDPFLSTLVSQRALYAAQNSLVSTQLSAMANRISLYRALGGGVTYAKHE